MTISQHPPSSISSSIFSENNFLSLFSKLIHPRSLLALHRQQKKSSAGAPSVLSLFSLIASMVFHVLQGSGTLSSHVRQLSGTKICDSSLSQRRQLLGFPFFHSLLERVLCPLAQPQSNPDSFYKTFRLVGTDGTQWSLINSAQIKKMTIKHPSRRNGSAFSKISLSALYELGTHNPLAAQIGIEGESEMALSSQLSSHLKND